jgi:hypothetical protein
MSYEKSEPGRVAPVIPGRHGPALMGKLDIYYLITNNKCLFLIISKGLRIICKMPLTFYGSKRLIRRKSELDGG